MSLANRHMLSLAAFPTYSMVGWLGCGCRSNGMNLGAPRRSFKAVRKAWGDTTKAGRRGSLEGGVWECAQGDGWGWAVRVRQVSHKFYSRHDIKGIISTTNGADIRENFLTFFEARGHKRLPSSSLVPDDPTVLLTIAGMLQFKPIFLGMAPRKHERATTTQKCIRTNDVENVGVTARHHTFFEMLGNFSFGDYFKKEAIQWAWELSTSVYKLPEDRIWVSVFESDDESEKIWKEVVGVPNDRIIRMGEEDNFWASGPTGPCGPCSELYYDFHPERGSKNVDLNDDSRFIEFYNLVFMELNRDAEGGLSPLKSKNIDTGLGLERMAQILQGVPNNYETDLLRPLLDLAGSLAGIAYETANDAQQRDLKVIGDHTRAITYLISDGVLPSNVGRGYVVRRLVRRTVMKGRILGIKDFFTAKLADAAIEMSEECDPAVKRNRERICSVLTQEESLFTKTLASGQKRLGEMLAAYKKEESTQSLVSGKDAFTLFDTYGFPLEITQEIVSAEGMTVDTEEFVAEMEAQRQRSKDAREEVDMMAGTDISSILQSIDSTEFLGYSTLKTTGNILAIFANGKQVDSATEGIEIEVVLDRSPFYAESGGQIGDQGTLVSTNNATVEIHDCQKAGGSDVFMHKGSVESGQVTVGDVLDVEVNANLRHRARCAHTATHLLQAALKQVLGEDTSQQGSLVSFDRLRFDFNLPRGMELSEIEQVETLVNSWIQQAHDLQTMTMAIDEARAAGATAMFGEKYGDVVRVVDVPGVSKELCGGTHVTNTSEIGGFKVLSEFGIQSGIRRIEAVAGPGVIDHLVTLDKVVRGLRTGLKVELEKIPERVDALQHELMASKKEIAALKNELAVAKAQGLVSKVITLDNGSKILVSQIDGVDGKALQEAAQDLLKDMGDPAAVVLGCSTDSKVNLMVAFSPGVVSFGLKAGQFVGKIAKICGGGGGGRPNLAQAGGRQPEKLSEALETAREDLTESLSKAE